MFEKQHILHLPIKLAKGGSAARTEKSSEAAGFLSVSVKDLDLDFADLLILVVTPCFVEY